MRILRTPDIRPKSGYCERQLRDLESQGLFPKRFLLNPNGRAVGWLESEVDAWIELRAATRVAATCPQALPAEPEGRPGSWSSRIRGRGLDRGARRGEDGGPLK